MNYAIAAAATQKGTIGCVHDSVRNLPGDVTPNDKNVLIHLSDSSGHGSSTVAGRCNIAKARVARPSNATSILKKKAHHERRRENCLRLSAHKDCRRDTA